MRAERLLSLAAAYLMHCECGMEPHKFFEANHLRGRSRRLVLEYVERLKDASRREEKMEERRQQMPRSPSWNSFI